MGLPRHCLPLLATTTGTYLGKLILLVTHPFRVPYIVPSNHPSPRSLLTDWAWFQASSHWDDQATLTACWHFFQPLPERLTNIITIVFVHSRLSTLP